MNQTEIEKLKSYTIEQLEKELNITRQTLVYNEEQRTYLTRKELEILREIKTKKEQS